MQDLHSLLPAMQRSFLLEGLSASECEGVLAGLPPPERFQKGTQLYSGTNFRRCLAVVLRGEVQVLRLGDDGRRVVMNRLIAGDVFGAAALYGGGDVYVTDVVAAKACTLLFLSQEQMSALMRRYPRIAENYIRFLSGRIRFLNGKIAEFTGGQTEERLLQHLRSHSLPDGQVVLSGSMVELAQALDIGRSSLYRSLTALEKAGKIRREGKTIFLQQRA